VKRHAVYATASMLLLVVAVARLTRDSTDDGAPSAAAGSGSVPDARVRAFWEAYREATRRRTTGDLEGAAKAYARALELNPQHEDALYYLGNVSLELGRFPEAAAAWERVVQVNPRSSRAHSRLGDLHVCVEPGAPVDLARAEAEFRRALDINQEETGPLLHLAEIALARDRWAAAKGFLDAVIRTNGESVEAHVLKGYAAWRRDDLREAAALFARAVELARPREPALGGPGEGDTRRGMAPLVSRPARCGALRSAVTDLAAFSGFDSRARMDAHYRRLGLVLEELRRR